MAEDNNLSKTYYSVIPIQDLEEVDIIDPTTQTVNDEIQQAVKGGNFYVPVGVNLPERKIANKIKAVSLQSIIDTNTTYENAIAYQDSDHPGRNGLMTAQDKYNLDWIYSHKQEFGLKNLKDGSNGSLRGIGTEEQNSNYTLGQNAFSEGYKTKASGNYSHAEGYQTIASGNNSFASGEGTIAEVKNQTVIGQYNKNNEDTDTNNLFIIGNGTDNSHRSNAFTVKLTGDTEVSNNLTVEGNTNISNNLTVNGNTNISNDLTINGNTEVSNDLTVGGNITADKLILDRSSQDSFEDNQVVTYRESQEIINNYFEENNPLKNLVDGSANYSVRGTGTKQENQYYTIGQYAFVEGRSTTASGPASHAQGNQTTAKGNYSHAEGLYTRAIGNVSHAQGYGDERQVLASGQASHAQGCDTIAEGDYSHAEGYYTQAHGNNSHSEGSLTQANGNNSHASGEGTIAINKNEFVIGSYNKYQEEGQQVIETPFISPSINYQNLTRTYTLNNNVEPKSETIISFYFVIYDNTGHEGGDIITPQTNLDFTTGSSRIKHFNTNLEEVETAINALFSISYDGVSTITFYGTIDALNNYSVQLKKIIYIKPSSTQNNLFVIGNGINNNNRSNALSVNKQGDLFVSGNIYAPNMIYTSQTGEQINYIDKIYPPGALYTTATKINPSTWLGGNWGTEPIKKGLKRQVFNSNNIINLVSWDTSVINSSKDHTVYVWTQDDTIQIRITFYLKKSTFSGSNTICTINGPVFGIIGDLHNVYSYMKVSNKGVILAGSIQTDANGAMTVVMDSVISRATSIPDLKDTLVGFSQVIKVGYGIMDNNFCDRFDWQRIS